VTRLTLRSGRSGQLLARFIEEDERVFVLDLGDPTVVADGARRLAHGITLWRMGELMEAPPNDPNLLPFLAEYYAGEGMLVWYEEPTWARRLDESFDGGDEPTEVIDRRRSRAVSDGQRARRAAGGAGPSAALAERDRDRARGAAVGPEPPHGVGQIVHVEAEPTEHRSQHVARGPPGVAQRADVQAPVGLAELSAVRTQDQRRVQVGRGRRTQGLPQADLGRRGVEQVSAAHDLGHAVPCVVGHHGEWVADEPVAPDEDRVTRDCGIHLDPPEPAIDKLDAAVRDAEPNGALDVARVAAGARVGAPRPGGSRAHAAVARQPGQRVVVAALRLPRRLFVPVEAEPAQIGPLAGLDLGPGPAEVDVLDPEQQPAPGRADREKRSGERRDVAEVQVSRRGGCEAPDRRDHQ
jgi:hypothetical protein